MTRGSSPARQVIAAFLVLAACIGTGNGARAQTAKSAERGEIILRNLPARGSRVYNELLGLAGSQARGQILRFSKTEMWSMPSPRIQRVIEEGNRLGVTVMRLGDGWNHVLRTPVASPPMNDKQERMMQETKSAPETAAVHMMSAPDPALVEYALMKDAGDPIGPPPAQGSTTHIILPFADGNLRARRTALDVRANGCTWRGVNEETGEPVMLMWWNDGRFGGMFTYRGRQFVLKSMGGEVHAVVETDTRKMPPDHGTMPGRGPSADAKDDPLVSRGEGETLRPSPQIPFGPGVERNEDIDNRSDALGTRQAQRRAKVMVQKPKFAALAPRVRRALAARKVTIDLMVLYTSKVASRYIDIDADLVALAVEQTNLSFANSGAGNVKVRLAHAESIGYDETNAEHFDHLYAMVDGLGAFKKVRALRNEKKADVVVLVVDDISGCGLSTRVGAEADEAFAVVHHSCAALSYSIAHEIGHILGARHDRSLDTSETPFPYGHGYVNGTKWRDIMSYNRSCNGCPRQPFWSNPTLTFLGDRGGTPDTDSARVILEQAERVARFR